MSTEWLEVPQCATVETQTFAAANGAVLDAVPYMDQAKAIRAAERLHAIVGTWHRENHAGPYLRCHQQPCRDLNRQEQG